MQTVNVSTGPVNISKEVLQALAIAPVSHRSIEFRDLYKRTSGFLCEQFNVKNAYLLTGSGTAANEAMIQQIKGLNSKGLILSNGEFGARLVKQARRASLQFIEHKLSWGEQFDISALEKEIQQHALEWVLFCHCETSTGVVNDLDSIAAICSRYNCRCFVDCMSTVGTRPLDLSNVAMATASSGKGLASVPGLAIVFSNIEVISSTSSSVYFDLGYYAKKENIPFTISSNLVNALNVSIEQKLQPHHFNLINDYSQHCLRYLTESNMLPYNNYRSMVFTISPPDPTGDFIARMNREQIVLSHESRYLKKRDLCQLALFGYYRKENLEHLVKGLKSSTAVSLR